jgi:hypothetical protein
MTITKPAVFISHSWEDLNIAEGISKKLSENNRPLALNDIDIC